MSFSKILDKEYYDDYQEHRQPRQQQQHQPMSGPLQFQMPYFLKDFNSTLAVGGGAEVLTPVMFNELSSAPATTWYENNNQKQVDNSSFQKQPQYTLVTEEQPPFNQFQQATDNPIYDNPTMPPGVLQNAGFMTHSNVGAGINLYSGSGFDLLSVLSRVVTRPNPKINLGPVDLTTSFIVADNRKWDHPIVYCSPTFLSMTGYEEHEVRGHNCRFLQSPNGSVDKGSERKATDPQAVAFIRKSLLAKKECQASLMNYRKNGEAFVNLVTIIPIYGNDSSDEPVYLVGFQVDLSRQPMTILKNVTAGTYNTNFNSVVATTAANNAIGIAPAAHLSTRDRKANVIPPAPISDILRSMLDDPLFVHSLPLHTATVLQPPQPSLDKLIIAESHESGSTSTNNQLLNLLLLEGTPDFLHVVSLKGSFLYVAPSVRGVLGYEPEDLVGKAIGDFCHPADVVPLMRELKESSVTPETASQQPHNNNQQQTCAPRTVDLLFRARHRNGHFVWVESRGRLHVEPGKGRKAIILSGRLREMPTFNWNVVARSGGLVPSHIVRADGTENTDVKVESEFWGMLSVSGTLLSAGQGVKDVLGWNAEDVIGTTVRSHVANSKAGHGEMVDDVIIKLGQSQIPGEDWKTLICSLVHKNGAYVHAKINIFRSTSYSSSQMVYQIQVYDENAPVQSSSAHSEQSNVFAELETARGSSWQYELQQLKFANKRLSTEVAQLESQQKMTVQQQHHQQQQQQNMFGMTSPVTFYERNAIEVQSQRQPDWLSASFYETTPTALKRSWDMANLSPG